MQRLAAIGWVHRQAGHVPPRQAEGGTVVAVLDERHPRPVATLRAWLKVAGITEKPVFRRLSRDGTLDQ